MRLDRLRKRHSENKLGIGFDFGTSNSAVALYDGERISVVQLEESKSIMPSASYIDRLFSVATGEQAIRDYVDGNRGRRVELSAEVLGEARFSTGGVDAGTGLPGSAETATVYGQEIDDASMPGRLFFGIKRLLGSVSTDRIDVFKKLYRIVALITPILTRMCEEVEHTRRDNASIVGKRNHGCIGHPVAFEGNAAGHNRLALDRLSEAYRHAGIVKQRFCPEPIAATIGYLQNHSLDSPFRALTVDFGGGTLDLCLVRGAGATLEVEAVHGIALGGDKIDQAIFRELIFPLLGKGEKWSRIVDGRRIETEFPFWKYEKYLLNWQVSYALNQNKFTTPLIEQMKSTGERALKFVRLYDLITNNAAFEVFQAIKQTKERLSSESAAVLDIPEIDLSVRVERAQFEAMIAELLAAFEAAVNAVLAKAQLSAADVDLVLRTGGSALIPAFAGILDRRFPGKVVEHDPFTSVAAGLAIADYCGIGAGSS
jgi:hypothetical chaperone protein